MEDEWDVKETNSSGWDDDTCKHCGNFVVTPQGRKTSRVLLVTDEPEPNNAYAFPSNLFSIIKAEMSYYQMDLLACRCITVWRHQANGNDDCYMDGVTNVIKETKNKDGVLLIGSSVTSYFTGYNVMEINGLNVPSKYFSTPIIMGCISPSVVFNGTVGELRFALRRFAEELHNV